MSTVPLSWIEKIQNLLIDAKAIPLHGFAPPFPWARCSAEIGELLRAPDLKINMGKVQFLPAEKAVSGLGQGALITTGEITPLTGSLFFAIGKEDVAKLCSLTLLEEGSNLGFSSPQFQEGYYHFLLQQALSRIASFHPFGSLGLKIGKSAPLPTEESLCIDLQIAHPQHTFWARIICPASLHQAFKAHFNTQPAPPLDSALKEKIDVSLPLEIGRTALTLSQWRQIAVGDVVILDRCTFDPTTRKGTLTLCLHQTPLLRARIKENSLKIVDYALYYEEENLMHPENPEEENIPEIPEEHPPQELSEEEEFHFSDLGEVDEENHLWAQKNGETPSTEKRIPTSEIPLTLTVEVARLSMNLAQLLQLSPGNILELPVRPEQGVDISINGKKIGKAELIKLGDLLGVKILQIGD